jgi:hypothetical protein
MAREIKPVQRKKFYFHFKHRFSQLKNVFKNVKNIFSFYITLSIALYEELQKKKFWLHKEFM